MIEEFNFSVSGCLNVAIKGINNKECGKFIYNAFKKFSVPILDPSFNINVSIEDVENISGNSRQIKLGEDAIIGDGEVLFKTGHYYKRKGTNIDIKIPNYVKRGRVPFKRKVVGRHVVDEVLEPIFQEVLLENGMTFLHASTIVVDDSAKVMMAWRNTGKTHAILNKINECEIFSDDLTILTNDGYVYPYPRPIRIYSYNIPSLLLEKKQMRRIKLKSKIMPPWKPVIYLDLPIRENRRVKVCDIEYLNDPSCSALGAVSQAIIDFEFSPFLKTKIILKLGGVITNALSVRNIVENYLLLRKR